MKNELKLKQYCNGNQFDLKYFQDVAIITTGTDVWKLEFIETYDNVIKGYKDAIRVRHQNKMGNKSKKNHFHTQRYAQDIDYVFNNIIIPHEQGNRVYQKAFRIKEILTHIV